MRLELPLPPFWHPIELEPDDKPGDDEPGARYFERRETGAAQVAEPAEPCMLTLSPLLPLPRSLPALVHEALASEPDFRLDWKWPMLTPRVGPWELVVQMCVGTSQSAGFTTGRLYVALDAGFGAYLIVCIDRDPQKLAARHKELLAILAGARLHRDPGKAPFTAAPDSKAGTEVVPPQLPPMEIYLKETLFSYLVD